MYDIEKIYEAISVDDAIKALQEDENAVVIAGGSDVLIKIREGKLAGCSLVSIHEIKELNGVTLDDDGTIVIGPTTTFCQITHDPIINKYISVLGRATDTAGGPQLRNVGTVGGNISNGVTSADSASTFFALDAIVCLKGINGYREIPIKEYYVGPGRTSREHTEIVVAIKIKKESYIGYYGDYYKYGMRNAMEIATMGCSINVKLNDKKDTLEDVRIAYGVAGPIPMRCHDAENALRGMKLTDDIYGVASRTVLTEVNPRTSWRATKEFRIQIIKEMCKRTLEKAINYALEA